MAISFGPVIPVLRMFDLAVTQRFYCEYLGCKIDWQDGQDDRPIYLQVSRDELVLHLSSHHGDGTPGTAVLIETRGLSDLHRELHGKSYPFMNPGLEAHPAGREMTVIDPASNLLRFFERSGVTSSED
jgi:catechol 2,3-dioxygenase-like lactoylglutathione lyase family enzyme